MVSGLDGNEIISKVASTGKDLSWLTGSLGFVVGVTQKDATYNQGAGNPYYSNPILVAKDFLSRLGLGGVTIASGYTTTNEWNPNIGAIVNKGTELAIGLAILKAIWPNKYTRAAYDVGFAPALGYGIGRIFDDPPYTSGGASNPQQRGLLANQRGTNLTRNGLPPAGMPWNA